MLLLRVGVSVRQSDARLQSRVDVVYTVRQSDARLQSRVDVVYSVR